MSDMIYIALCAGALGFIVGLGVGVCLAPWVMEWFERRVREAIVEMQKESK